MATQKEIKLCQEIIGVAIKVNAQGKYSVWTEFHGHVNGFEVRVTGKYDKGREDIEGWGCADRCVYLSTERDFGFMVTKDELAASLVKQLEELKADLSKFLVKGKVKA